MYKNKIPIKGIINQVEEEVCENIEVDEQSIKMQTMKDGFKLPKELVL
jgi:hypothetical protein